MSDRETSIRKYRYCYLSCLFHIVFLGYQRTDGIRSLLEGRSILPKGV